MKGIITIQTFDVHNSDHPHKEKIFRVDLPIPLNYADKDVKELVLYHLRKLLVEVEHKWELANVRCQTCGREKP